VPPWGSTEGGTEGWSTAIETGRIWGMERSFRAKEATSAELVPVVLEVAARTGKPLCFRTGAGRGLAEATTTGAVLSSERRRSVTVDVSMAEEELRR
jgi:hypothetical protein